MKRIYRTLLLLLLISCNTNQNETSLFKDLALDGDKETYIKEVVNKKVRRIATIIKKTKLRINPLETNNAKILLPGERVSLLGDTIYVTEIAKKLLKVQNQYEEKGWIEESSLIMDTKIGTVIKNTQVFSKPDIFAKRTETINYGEIVLIRQNQNNGWYIITRDYEETEYWINNLSSISFEKNDVKLAELRTDILSGLPNPQNIFQLKATVDCVSYKSSVFYNEFFDSLYKYQEDTLIID